MTDLWKSLDDDRPLWAGKKREASVYGVMKEFMDVFQPRNIHLSEECTEG